MENAKVYNQSKTWQLIMFASLQAGANMFMMAMNFSSYIATGFYGVAVVLTSLLLTGTRIWDAITDPIVGFVVDRTQTKWGRFRPLLLIGYLTMSLSTLIMFFWGKGGIVTFTICYVIYVIGYTMVNVTYKAAIPVMTNDPKQRPMIGRFQAFFTVTLSTVFSIYMSKVIMARYGGFTTPALQELLLTAIALSGVCYLLGIIALKDKDKPEIIANLSTSVQPKLTDCLTTIKGNRPLQMVMIAAVTDKLAQMISTNSSINIMLFGILIGNYTFNGMMSLYAYIPSLLFIILITGNARKLGSKKAVIAFSWIGIIITALSIMFMMSIDPTTISVAAVPTAIFVLLTICRSSVIQANSAMTNVMIADCSDYEMYRTGKFMPGQVATIFSFVDKLVSSFSTTIVGLVVATIGYTETLPAVGDPSTKAIFWVTMFLAYGTPMLGWICSVIALRFYNLTPEKMAEVQKSNAELRAKSKKA